jgi:hypothetical protein
MLFMSNTEANLERVLDTLMDGMMLKAVFDEGDGGSFVCAEFELDEDKEEDDDEIHPRAVEVIGPALWKRLQKQEGVKVGYLALPWNGGFVTQNMWFGIGIKIDPKWLATEEQFRATQLTYSPEDEEGGYPR